VIRSPRGQNREENPCPSRRRGNGHGLRRPERLENGSGPKAGEWHEPPLDIKDKKTAKQLQQGKKDQGSLGKKKPQERLKAA